MSSHVGRRLHVSIFEREHEGRAGCQRGHGGREIRFARYPLRAARFLVQGKSSRIVEGAAVHAKIGQAHQHLLSVPIREALQKKSEHLEQRPTDVENLQHGHTVFNATQTWATLRHRPERAKR